MLEPPPQLRVRTDLDGLHLTVSGKPWSVVPILQSSVVQTGGWLLVGALCLLSCDGAPSSLAMAFGIALVLQAFKMLDPVRGAKKTRLSVNPAQLEVRSDTATFTIPWGEIGLVTENGRSVVVQRAGHEPLSIPMELEPPEHAVWLAMTIDERAMEARQERGTAADVPRSIRQLRT